MTDDAIAIIEADHREGGALLDIYERLAEDGSVADKSGLASRLCGRLITSARVEEEIFYPALRQALAESAVLDAAQAALAVARALIRKVAALQPADLRHDATIAALGECFRSHADYVRAEIFPRATVSGIDLQALGARLAMRKLHLLAEQGAD